MAIPQIIYIKKIEGLKAFENICSPVPNQGVRQEMGAVGAEKTQNIVRYISIELDAGLFYCINNFYCMDIKWLLPQYAVLFSCFLASPLPITTLPSIC